MSRSLNCFTKFKLVIIKSFRHLEIGTLSWSLIRLFGCYERIMSVISLPRNEREFLDADLEYFIIRFRIILNDIAFIVNQILPKNVRDLKGPSGPDKKKPQNKEMSIFNFVTYFKANVTTYPEFAKIFSKAESWIIRMRKDRDNIVHYKSKAMIFDTTVPSFALLNAANDQPMESTPEGGTKLVLEPVGEFVNSQFLALNHFMHQELVEAIKTYAIRVGIKIGHFGGIPHSCVQLFGIGVKQYKEYNFIKSKF
jgi:hypothetical protein